MPMNRPSLLGATLAAALATTLAAQRGGGEYRGPGPLTPAVGPQHDADLIYRWHEESKRSGGTVKDQALGLRALERWEFWWELNRERFLARSGPPRPLIEGGSETREKIAMALRAAFGREEDPDIREACLIALGKGMPGGRRTADAPFLDEALKADDPILRAAAALAFGIGSDTGAVLRLIERAASDEDVRTRAFACYALGLIGSSAERTSEKKRCLSELFEVAKKRNEDQEVRIAAMIAAGMVRPEDERLGKSLARPLWRVAERLLDRHENSLLSGHIASTASRWCLAFDDRSTLKSFAARCVPETFGPSDPKTFGWVRDASVAIALGGVTDSEHLGFDIDEKLKFCILGGGDVQTRAFATMACAERGGAAARELLADRVRNETRSLELSWAAIALGTLVHPSTRMGSVDRLAAATLLSRFKRTSDHRALAALGLGLGLVGDRNASDALLECLKRNASDDSLAGYLCIALAMLREPRAEPTIRRLMQSSDKRPVRLRQAVRAASLVGLVDGPQLTTLLANSDLSSATLGTIVHAAGSLRDASSIPTLLHILRNHDSLRVRSIAAAALGALVDDRSVHWSQQIIDGINYRAAVPTLSDGAGGVLDLY